MAPHPSTPALAGITFLLQRPHILGILSVIIMVLQSLLSFAINLFTATAATCWRDTVCNERLASFPGPWDSYMHSPSSRTVSPVKILASNHTVLSSYPGAINLNQNGSLLILDFGQEVGGIVTLNYAATGSGKLGLAFSESWNWTGMASDGSNGAYNPEGDGALITPITATTAGNYTMPDVSLRGGFRYLSLFTITNSTINMNITSITLEISFQPTWSDLRAYGGYFYSNDDLINRIWYAGAYTLQTNAIQSHTARVYPLLDYGWRNDAYLGTLGSSIFVDGSKRDRATWAGDLGIALPSAFVSTGDFESAKNALQLQYDLQMSTGELPMAGPPLNFSGSDTYHLTTLIATYEYILHSADMEFLASNWANITSAINYSISKIDSSGLLFVTGNADWARYAQGGRNTEANALMYRALVTGSIMASWTNNPSLAATWTSKAEILKAAINKESLNWDSIVGAFRDSDTDPTLHPEDGNSLALQYNLSLPDRSQNISNHLISNWTPIGALCPELPGNIVPYIESMEIHGHLAIQQTARALQLIRSSWGWYLNNPFGTESTTPEGYLGDGSWGYRTGDGQGYMKDASYMSHAHGWGTGPTHALSWYVLGLQMVRPGGRVWRLEPQFGDLEWVEGGYSTPLGKFFLKWVLDSGGYTLGYEVPEGTEGTVVLPATGGRPSVEVDGKVYGAGIYDAGFGNLVIENQPGGKHFITVMY